jgi:hypothetical protein
MGLEGGLGHKRSWCVWMSEASMILQLDPLDHHFDPEGQVPTLWTSTSWSTGSEGRFPHNRVAADSYLKLS